MSDAYIVTSPLYDEVVPEVVESPTTIDFDNFSATSSAEEIEETGEMFALTAPAPVTQIIYAEDTSFDARFAGLLAHVRWLINQDERVVVRKTTSSDDLFDKQIENTTDDLLDSVGDVRDDLETDLTSLDNRLTQAEADLASISLAAASTSVMAANLTMNGHWLSGDGADEGIFVTAAGNVGVGTSTPGSRFSVAGDIYATGALRDSSNGAGTSGYVLQSTGSGTQWVATSTLGITGSGSSFSTSAELATLLSDEVGTSGGFVRSSSTALTSPNIFGATLIGSISGGTFTSGTWQGNAISSTYLDSAVILNTEIDSSAELISLVTDETGTGALVFANSPTLTGTLSGASATFSGTLGVSGATTLATTTASTLTVTGALRDSSNNAGTAGMVLQTTGSGTQWVATSSLGITGGGASFTTSAELATILLDETGTGAAVFANSPTLVTPNLGIPSAITLTNATGLPISTGVDGLASGVAAFLASSTSANLASAVSNETGTGSLVFATSPTFSTQLFVPQVVGGSTGASGLALKSTSGVGTTDFIRFLVGNNGATEAMRIVTNGNVGIGTTTPDSKLTVAGDIFATGALRDSSNNAGTAGMVLQTTGSGTQWVATSSLGFPGGSGVTNFLALTDTPSSYTANRIMYTNSGATALVDSADFTYDGTNLGLGGTGGIAFGGTRYLSASTTNDSITFGENAGETFNGSTTYYIAIGYEAGRYASSTGNYNSMIGFRAGYNNIGLSNNIMGPQAGYNNTGSQNNIFGTNAGYNNTGTGNNFIGTQSGQLSYSGDYNSYIGAYAGRNSSGSYNNFIGENAARYNTGSYNDVMGYRAGYYAAGSYNVLVGAETMLGSGVASTSRSNNVAIGRRAGYNATTGADNNILIGYQAAENLTSGSKNIVIGYDIDLVNASDSNTLNIGNLIFGTTLDGTDTTVSSGKIGIGTTTPDSKLTVAGDIFATGALRDSSNNAGTAGMVLQTTGSGTQWVATSSLGFPGGSGVTNFLALTDTPSSYTANRIMYTNSGATALVDSADFVFTGTNLGVGTSTPGSRLTVAGDISTTYGYKINGVDVVKASSTIHATAIGFDAAPSLTSGMFNTGVGAFSLFSATSSTANTAVGYGSLYSNTSGVYNSALGSSALLFNSSGSYNSGFGGGTLYNNTTGDGNSAFGSYGLYSNTTGGYSTAVGANALYNSIDGGFNLAFGYDAGRYIADGTTPATSTDFSVYIGNNTKSLTGNDQNAIVIGYNAAGIGSNSVVLGNDSVTTTVLKGNVGLGTTTPASKLSIAGDMRLTGAFRDSTNASGTLGMVLQSTGTSTRWVATSTLGITGGSSFTTSAELAALLSDETGSGAVVFANSPTLTGTLSGASASLSGLLTVSGTSTLATTTASTITITGALRDSSSNAGTAGMVLQSTGSGTSWVATSSLGIAGGGSLFTDAGATTYLTSTSDNLSIGTTTSSALLTVDGTIAALDGIKFGGQRSVFIDSSSNMSFGEWALFYAENNSNVYSNIGIGDNASNNLRSGFSNVFMGFSAGANVATGSRSVIIGDHAVGNNPGLADIGSMVVIGDGAGADLENGANWSTLVGYRAGENITTGSGNTVLGYQAGNNITTGWENIIIGYDIDAPSATGFQQLSIGNLIFGTGLDGTGTTTSSGNIGIGTSTPGAKLTVAGTVQSTDLLGGATNLTTDANGNIIRDPSDARLKENVETLDGALEKVLALRGVSYEWIDKERFGEQVEIGFIAQEVDEVVPEVVTKGGEYWSLNSKNLVAVVVEAMKEVWAKVSGHEERLGELEAENAELKARLDAVEQELNIDNNIAPEPTPDPVSEEPVIENEEVGGDEQFAETEPAVVEEEITPPDTASEEAEPEIAEDPAPSEEAPEVNEDTASTEVSAPTI